MAVQCRTFTDHDAPAWDSFVASHPAATFFHRAAWRDVIARSFGHRSHYFLAERAGAICGVLPLVEIRARLFGHRLVSTPFCVEGGPLADGPETLDALLDAAARLLAETGAGSCELRGGFDADQAGRATDAGWQQAPALYETFRKRLPNDESAVLKSIPRKQRAVVRKAIDAGLEARTGRDIEPFYGLYAESVRNLGTPVFSRRYIAALLAAFPDNAEILTVHDQGKPVCGVLSFSFRDQILPYYAGGGHRTRQVGGYDFMYYTLMRSAVARGLTLFDFGRSKIGTGAHKFKQNWGFAPTPLDYRYRLTPGARIPEHNPLNPKYAAMIAVWKRLPMPVANMLGPMIVRGLG